MSYQRRTKKVIILEELSHKINSAQMISGSEFPSAKELAQSYQISVRTASGIVRELSRMGLLDTGPGRRSRVLSKYNLPLKPDFPKPIGVISPKIELLQTSRWREWLLRHLQQALQADGYQPLWVSENFDSSGLADAYSGFVVAGEQLPANRWEMLQKTGLPCVKLSFDRPQPNSIYVDCRPALDKVALYLARQKCKKIILLTSCENESKHTFNCFSEVGFIQTLQDYDIDSQGFYRVVMTPTSHECLKTLLNLTQGAHEKVAFLAGNASYSKLIDPIMREQRRIPGKDYEIVSLSCAPQEEIFGRGIDLNCSIIVDEMLKVLYLQKITGEVQLSKIIYADFIESF